MFICRSEVFVPPVYRPWTEGGPRLRKQTKESGESCQDAGRGLFQFSSLLTWEKTHLSCMETALTNCCWYLQRINSGSRRGSGRHRQTSAGSHGTFHSQTICIRIEIPPPPIKKQVYADSVQRPSALCRHVTWLPSWSCDTVTWQCDAGPLHTADPPHSYGSPRGVPHDDVDVTPQDRPDFVARPKNCET